MGATMEERSKRVRTKRARGDARWRAPGGLRWLTWAGVFALLTLPAAASGAQASAPALQLIQVGEDRPVSADEPALPHVEPHLAVNPADPRHLLAGSIVFRDDRMTSEVLLSLDGGAGWTRTRFPGCAGDPWLAWGSGENAYFSCLAAGDAPTGVLVFRSNDGGRSWGEAVAVPRGDGGSFDHTSLAVLPRPDSGDVVYMAGMQGLQSEDRPPISAAFVAVSRDGAVSFDPPHRLVWSNVMSNALNPVVLGPDAVGMAFVDFSVDGRSMIDHRRLWWAYSGDRGRSFSVPHLVADVSRVRTGPVVGAAPPRPGPAPVYLGYDNVIDGRQGVYVVRSGDGGVTWSEPAALSVGEPTSFRAENPVTAVDATGTVGVAWYERPPGGGAACWRIRFAASTDGGRSFLDPVTVSSEDFCARPEEVERARRWSVGGDYFGLVATGEGTFRVLWADSRTGTWQARTAVARLGGPPAPSPGRSPGW